MLDIDLLLDIYWDWYWTIWLVSISMISFLAGYQQRKLTRKRMKIIRFYKPKDNLCAVYDAQLKITYQQYSVSTADVLLKTLNLLYYQEEITNAQRKRPEDKS